MWDQVWDEIFNVNEWGKYPPEELIRFIARNFYKCNNRKNVKILEVGSGTGANLWYFAKEGFNAFGIDGSNVGVSRAKERLKNESLEADIRVGDIVNLPFEDDMFDCVVDNECIYANNLEDSKKIIDEVYRVLKPSGKFFSKTFMTGSWKRKGCGLIRLTSEEDIHNLYKKFKIDSIDYTNRTENNRSRLIKEWIIICSKHNNKDG